MADAIGTVTYVKAHPQLSSLTVKFVDPRTGKQKEEVFPCKYITACKYIEGDKVEISLMGIIGISNLLPQLATWQLTEEKDKG